MMVPKFLLLVICHFCYWCDGMLPEKKIKYQDNDIMVPSFMLLAINLSNLCPTIEVLSVSVPECSS